MTSVQHYAMFAGRIQALVELMEERTLGAEAGIARMRQALEELNALRDRDTHTLVPVLTQSLGNREERRACQRIAESVPLKTENARCGSDIERFPRPVTVQHP